MFLQMVRVEHQKLIRRKILWIELAIVAAAAILLPLLMYAATQSEGNSNLTVTTDGPIEEMIAWPSALQLGIGMATGSGFGGLLIIILISTLTAQEYGWRTMQLWLGQGVSRPVLLLAKFTAVLLPTLLLVITPFVAGALATAIFTKQLNGSLPLADVNWWQVTLSILRTAYTLLPYAAFTFFLAIISRSTVVAVGIGLTYNLLLESLLVQLTMMAGGTWAKIGQYLPMGLSNSLVAANRVTDSANSLIPQIEGVAPETAVIGIALYTIIFVGLALLVFRRQDLGG